MLLAFGILWVSFERIATPISRMEHYLMRVEIHTLRVCSCLLAMPVPNGYGRRAEIHQLPVSSMKQVPTYKGFKAVQQDEDSRFINDAWPPYGG